MIVQEIKPSVGRGEFTDSRVMDKILAITWYDLLPLPVASWRL